MKTAALAIRALILLAACGSSTPAPAPGPHEPAAPDPAVDAKCIERAREGKLLYDLPSELGAFHVGAADAGAHLHRDGRELSDAEAEKLWQQMNTDVFAAGGLATGHSGHSSIYTCSDAPKNNCFKYDAFICQVDLATLVTRLTSAAEHAGVADAALTVDISFIESHGPSCHAGADCTPVTHYSVKGTYDPAKQRHVLAERGRGACRDDGDCEGAQSNNCTAWYLRGGAETLLGIMYDRPTFCGCVEQRCSWFTQ